MIYDGGFGFGADGTSGGFMNQGYRVYDSVFRD